MAAPFAARMSPPLSDPPPDGDDLRKELVSWFKKQAKAVLGRMAQHMGAVPESFPSLADYDDPMSRAMTPMISAYWHEAGPETLGRLEEATGLDLADRWQVVNPHLRSKIEQSTLNFCHETNKTTTMQINDALDTLRQSLVEGIVTHGEVPHLLVQRVKDVFRGAEDYRAERIAMTEASRAVHAAQLEADEESGVVAGLEWLLSTDACPLCHKQEDECKRVRLGDEFSVIGDHPDYSSIRYPPLHPSCQCTVVEILKPEYGGPHDPEWGETLDQPAATEHDEEAA